MQLEMKSGKVNKSKSGHYYLLKPVWKENITPEEHLHKCKSKRGFCCSCHLPNDLVSEGFSSPKLLRGHCGEDSGMARSVTQQKKGQSQGQHPNFPLHAVPWRAAVAGTDGARNNAAIMLPERTPAECLEDVVFMWNSHCPQVPAPWERDGLLRIWAKSFLFLRFSVDHCCGCERS